MGDRSIWSILGGIVSFTTGMGIRNQPPPSLFPQWRPQLLILRGGGMAPLGDRHRDMGVGRQGDQRTVSGGIICHCTNGNQRDFIKEKGWLAGNDCTYNCSVVGIHNN
jgi:hypothetical protein